MSRLGDEKYVHSMLIVNPILYIDELELEIYIGFLDLDNSSILLFLDGFL